MEVARCFKAGFISEDLVGRYSLRLSNFNEIGSSALQIGGLGVESFLL